MATSSITENFVCGVDDVVLATSAWPSEGIDDVAVDGIPVSWFDEHGLERDPEAVVPGSKCPQLSKLGYTIGDIYASGIRPEDDEPLKITTNLHDNLQMSRWSGSRGNRL